MNILIIKFCYNEEEALPLTLGSLNRDFMNENLEHYREQTVEVF